MIFACQRSSLRLRKCSPDLEVDDRKFSTTCASFSGRVRARLRLRSGVRFAICCEVVNCSVGGRSIGVEDPQVVSCTLDCLCIVPQYARSAGVMRSRRIGFSGSSMVGKTRSRNSRSAGVSGEQLRIQAPVSEVSSSPVVFCTLPASFCVFPVVGVLIDPIGFMRWRTFRCCSSGGGESTSSPLDASMMDGVSFSP